jgi:hypothetical protein
VALESLCHTPFTARLADLLFIEHRDLVIMVSTTSQKAKAHKKLRQVKKSAKPAFSKMDHATGATERALSARWSYKSSP